MDEFDEICRRCTPVVYRFLLSLCKDASLADELTAETFYQAYLHIDTFRGNCRVESWLCQIAKNALTKEPAAKGAPSPSRKRTSSPRRTTFLSCWPTKNRPCASTPPCTGSKSRTANLHAARARRTALSRHCRPVRQIRVLGKGHILPRQGQADRRYGGTP